MNDELNALQDTKERRDSKEGSMLPVEYIGEQMLSDEDAILKAEAYARLAEWQQDNASYYIDADKCRKIYRLEDPDQDPKNTPLERRTLQLQTLKSTINNCVADQMDNTPEAMLIPENAEVQGLATEATDAVNFIMDQNNYSVFHRERVEDFFIAGTAVTQIGWDDEMDNGKGNICVVRHPIESIVWDPMAEDIQDARAIIKLSWHPRSWFAEHYPDEAKYIADESDDHENIGLPESASNVLNQNEGRSLLMEYWYRRFDSKKNKYTINVAYFAGYAMLDKLTDVYAHGKYPFVFDVFTRIPGQPVGEGMVHELVPMMRYINRYARYIDANLRASAKARMLARKGSGIDLDQLADWEQDIVEGESVTEEDVRFFNTVPLTGMVSNQMAQFQDDLKMDSGQNNFTRGETGGGVTAASAISALQEAGGKITRMRTSILCAGYKKIVEQILWLIAQFYKEDRQVMIAGENVEPKAVMLSAHHLMGSKAKDGRFPPPPYFVQVQVQRRNPLRVQAQNDLILQAYSMAAQAGQNFPLSLLFKLLNVDGKDRILPALQELDMQQQMMQEMQAQNEQLAAENENLKSTVQTYADNLSREVEMDSEAMSGMTGSEFTSY